MNRRSLPAFAAIDFLSCLLVVFVAVALTSRPPQVKTYGVYAVVITWPTGDNDVDLYVRDPGGGICFFANTQVDSMQLEHDDLGTAATNYGKQGNQERIVIRSPNPGEYVANVHLYDRRTGVGPFPVKVELWRLSGVDSVVDSRTVTLNKTGDEQTAFRFTLNTDGSLAGTSTVPVSLLTTDTIHNG